MSLWSLRLQAPGIVHLSSGLKNDINCTFLLPVIEDLWNGLLLKWISDEHCSVTTELIVKQTDLMLLWGKFSTFDFNQVLEMAKY